MNKATNSGSVKTSTLNNGKNDKKGNPKEIKEKVTTVGIFDLVNGLSNEPTLAASDFPKKPVENGKHIFSDENKLPSKDAVLNHTNEVTSEQSNNKSKTNANADVYVNHMTETFSRQGAYPKSKKSKLKKPNDLPKPSRDGNAHNETLHIVGSENVTSLDKPKDDDILFSSCIVEDVLYTSGPGDSDVINSETVVSVNKVVEGLENLTLSASPKVDTEACDGGNQIETLSPISYVQYENELQMPMIMKIIQKDLSEPYSIYTYRYFIHNWPKLCFLAMCDGSCVGAIVCKLDLYRKVVRRGYIAMLAVDQKYRKRGIGSTLVRRAIQEMIKGEADEVVLETEITNKPALKLYEALGFVRDKRLFRYYLNGVDALRLKLWLR